eukprot:g32882.t1
MLLVLPPQSMFLRRKGSLDLAMNVSNKLAKLDLEAAEASNRRQEGGFEQINEFLVDSISEVLHKLREQFTRNIDSLEKDLARKMNRNLAKGHENGDDYRLDGTVARCGQNSWMIEMKPDVDAGCSDRARANTAEPSTPKIHATAFQDGSSERQRAIALLAKWHPTGRSILQECCALVEAPPIQARLQDRSDGLRLALCRDCVQPDESVLGTLDVTGRRRPPRPTGDAVRAVRRNRLEELLLTLRASDVWRRGLQSRDASTQLATGRLANMVANRLDDEVLLSCLGLMLEAEATLRENASYLRHVEGRLRRVAAPGVLGFVVRAAVSDEWRQVKEALTLKLGDVKAQAVQEMADEVKSTARDWWDAQLSGDAAQRVADLCLRLGGKAEHEPSFIPATLSLLLSLARKSADYRQVKNKPLSDIEFRPMQISTSSWASTALPQTFQLGSVWASTYRGTASQTRTLALGGGQIGSEGADGALPRELRARKELPPVPSFHAQAKPAGGGAGGTSTAPVAPAGAGTGLLRHTEEDSRRVAIFRKERETKAALASLERREREGVEEDVVDLVSGYREGSYPDVEVSLADILEPLARAATEDLGLAEELLLAVWCGLTAKEVLSGAFNGLLSGCLGDVTLVHFLHSLVVRCSQDYGKTLPLPALQRTLGFSELSGIQALEELLESGLGRSGVARLVATGAAEEPGMGGFHCRHADE